MKRHRRGRWCAFGALTVLFLAVGAGCRDSTSPTTISFVVRTGVESDGLRQIANVYSKRSGIKVETIELGRDGYLSAVPTQLFSRSAAFDIAFVPSTMVSELAAASAILPLDGMIDTKDPDLVHVYRYKGQTYALPTDISVMLMYYRTDLIAAPPETWQDLQALATRFSKATNPQSPTEYGWAFPGMSGEELPKAFYSVLWSFGGFLMADGRIGVGTPESIAAANVYRSAVESGATPKDITSWGFAQVYENLENGKLAIAAPFWNAAASLLLKSKSPYREKIAWTLAPGTRDSTGTLRRVPFQHAWTLAVTATSKNPKIAADFVAFATSREGGRLYAQAVSGTPARYSLLDDSELRKVRPEFEMVSKSLRLARAEPETVKYAFLHDVMNTALTRVPTRAATPQKAMTEAAASLEKIK